LIRPGDDRDAPQDPLLVDLSWYAVAAGPVRDRPTADAFLEGEGHLVEVALVLQQVLGPGLVDDVDELLVHLPVALVDLTAVHRRRFDGVALPQDVHPALLVAPGEAGVHPSLGEVVEDGELLRHPQRITRRQHQRQGGELDPLRPCGQVGVEDQRSDRRLVALGVEVVLGGREAVEAGVVGHDAEGAYLLQHGLVALVVAADRPEPLPILERAGHGRQDEQLELHR
jgi:hypothetical protein